MTELRSHYPGYNVMLFENEWDSTTKEIVKKRLGPFTQNKFFSSKEAIYISIIAQHITYDDRENIIAWIVHHFDEKLYSQIGEGQRKPTTPPEKKLIRDGLRALDRVSKLVYKKDFGSLKKDEQVQILDQLAEGTAPQVPDWSNVPQKELFKKLSTTIVSAYYSHPDIWSEIGYPGPAYPRGYIRIELNITDPWEAKSNGK